MNMKRNKLIHSLFQIPLLALLSIIVACSTDDEPVVLNQHTDETQAPIYPKQEEDEAYKFAEQMPAFQGGEEEMFRFLGKNVRYPKQAKEAGIEGIVVLSFVVEKDGSVSNIKTVKSLSPEIDKEALRVIKMTDNKWDPGLQDGEPVRVEYTLPMRFTMK
jgi:TonB family protein